MDTRAYQADISISSVIITCMQDGRWWQINGGNLFETLIKWQDQLSGEERGIRKTEVSEQHTQKEYINIPKHGL